jgi:tight adherence protein C
MNQAAMWVGAIVCLLSAALLLGREWQFRTLNARVARAMADGPGRSRPLLAMAEWLSGIGARYRRFYHPENIEQLKTMLQSAGFNPHRMTSIVLGGKILSMLLFPTAALILSVGQPFNTRFLIVLLGVVAGIMGPRMGLGFIRRRFNAAIQRGTPDAIDLLVVCCEAGMGLEAGIERVTQEMQRSSPAVSRVLSGLLDDLRMLPDRRDAFNNLSNRSTCEGLRRFGTMLNQSLQYGTPLGEALRAIAEELRRDRITRLEARAHKLGAKLTIPMVIFMLPAMFVILGGGPGLDLMHSLRGIR